MRILVLSLYFPPHHRGGYEIECREVMTRLAARGHEVTVLTSDHRVAGVDDPPDERAARVRRDLHAYFRDDDLYSPPVHTRWVIERHNQRALRSALEAARPDVVSVWQAGALSLGLITSVVQAGLPVVFSVCDDWLSYGPVLDAWSRLFTSRPRLGRWVRPVVRVPTVLPDLGAAGWFCFISETVRERAERHSPWTFPRSGIVYGGIDVSAFPARADGPDRPWEGRLLYVGRYDPRKGIETLVRGLALLADSSLVVEGTGDAGERDRLAALASELGVAERVEFGLDRRGGLVDRYTAADAVVFPSEWEEPFGLVPLEAMACGAPVVATGAGGSGEFLVDGVNSVLFEAGDAAGLAAAVTRVAGDPVLRARLAANGFTTARYFDVEPLTDAIEAWHTAAVTDGPVPPSRRFDLGGGNG